MSRPRLAPGRLDAASTHHPLVPTWVANLTAALAVKQPRRAHPQTDQGGRRPAAVLVALVDTQIGPQLLLTRRTTTLSDYPGYISLPGGSVEPTDRTPVDTALREAGEETGLDPRSVQVIGQLAERPAGSKYAVIPVIAWSSRLQFASRSNPDEVTRVALVPLAELVKHTTPQTRRRPSHVGPIGPMTADVIAEVAASCGV